MKIYFQKCPIAFEIFVNFVIKNYYAYSISCSDNPQFKYVFNTIKLLLFHALIILNLNI